MRMRAGKFQKLRALFLARTPGSTPSSHVETYHLHEHQKCQECMWHTDIYADRNTRTQKLHVDISGEPLFCPPQADSHSCTLKFSPLVPILAAQLHDIHCLLSQTPPVILITCLMPPCVSYHKSPSGSHSGAFIDGGVCCVFLCVHISVINTFLCTHL